MTTTTNAPRVAQDLRLLLHPADDRDVPVPGFPTHDALVAWAREQPNGDVVAAAIDVLRDDGWPQQYAAAVLLRELGVAVTGDGHGHSFRWLVKAPDRGEVAVEPAMKPADPS
jgi:hypothetical protein